MTLPPLPHPGRFFIGPDAGTYDPENALARIAESTSVYMPPAPSEPIFLPDAPSDAGTYDPDALVLADPTLETYGDLNRAFQVFNRELFNGVLDPSLITLRATGKCFGYFSPNRFVHADGRRTHEIALNAEAFAYQTIENSLSTLLHEQVHQVQFQERTAGRRGYHNRDFAKRMRVVGLVASNTGRPGGNDVGEQMWHYIDADGPFLECVRRLLNSNFRARWSDRFVSKVYPEWISTISSPIPTVLPPASDLPEPGPFELPDGATRLNFLNTSNLSRQDDGEEANHDRQPAPPMSPLPPMTPPRPAAPLPPVTSSDLTSALSNLVYPGGEPPMMAGDPNAFVLGRPARKDPSKRKFVCSECKAAAWGKQSLKLICAPCNTPLTLVEK